MYIFNQTMVKIRTVILNKIKCLAVHSVRGICMSTCTRTGATAIKYVQIMNLIVVSCSG